MKTKTTFAFAALAATVLMPAIALAQDSRNQGYLVDINGNIVTTSNTGLCWRDSDWTPARSVEPCDPSNKPSAAVPAAKPQTIAAASPEPAGQPAAQPAAAMTQPQKISFSADALFAFDRSVLKPEGKAMLDGLADQLNGATYDVILVTGHADRFGSAKYNQKLSERRANTVKEYLVFKGIQASRIDAEGKGETQPITKAGDCKGAKSAKVIACLQPDRRVDVEMKGTKSSAK